MQIERKGSGPWADVAVDGVLVTVSVGEEKCQFDCAALQQDMQLTIDLVMGLDGRLCETAANGGEYVANLIVPPRRYADVDLPVTLAEEPLPEGVDPQGITPAPVVETVAVPLEEEEMEAVRLILWTINPVNNAMEMF